MTIIMLFCDTKLKYKKKVRNYNPHAHGEQLHSIFNLVLLLPLLHSDKAYHVACGAQLLHFGQDWISED